MLYSDDGSIMNTDSLFMKSVILVSEFIGSYIQFGFFGKADEVVHDKKITIFSNSPKSVISMTQLD